MATLAAGPSIIPDEEPLFFSSAGRPLYGAFHPAAEGRPGAPVVVFCNSVGHDHVANWRIEVLGARMAAARGYPAFCHHARGHGDSAGNFCDVTFEGLVEDAFSAADYARHLSGASRIVWVGIRFGALVAAEAIRRRRDAAALALWEPVHRARDYFRALLRSILFFEVSQGRRPDYTVDQLIQRLDRDGQVDTARIPVYRTFYSSALDNDLRRSLEAWSGPTFIAQVQRRHQLSPDNAVLKAALEQRGSKVAVALIGEEPAWDRLPDPPWTSEALLRDTGEWLYGLA